MSQNMSASWDYTLFSSSILLSSLRCNMQARFGHAFDHEMPNASRLQATAPYKAWLSTSLQKFLMQCSRGICNASWKGRTIHNFTKLSSWACISIIFILFMNAFHSMSEALPQREQAQKANLLKIGVISYSALAVGQPVL